MQQQGYSYNNANQVVGWSYDAAGNLTSDGTTSYSYDALNCLLTQSSTTNTFNGDGVLITQATGSNTITYTQDLVAPLSQVLNDGTATYIYGSGAERLFGVAGGVQTWYIGDALGSVRQTQNSLGAIQQFIT